MPKSDTEKEQTPDQPVDGESALPAVATPSDEVLQQSYGLTKTDYAILRSTVCMGAPQAQAALFLAAAKRYRLDPFRRQIYLVKQRAYNKDINRWEDSWVIVTGIDGYRAIAARSGAYRGQDAPIWYEDDEGKLVSCTIVVHRKGHHAYHGIAFFDECAKKIKTSDGERYTTMWEKMPRHMLAVRAEVFALRKAFPEDLGGLLEAGEIENGIENVTPTNVKPSFVENMLIEDDVVSNLVKQAGWTRAKFAHEYYRRDDLDHETRRTLLIEALENDIESTTRIRHKTPRRKRETQVEPPAPASEIATQPEGQTSEETSENDGDPDADGTERLPL